MLIILDNWLAKGRSKRPNEANTGMPPGRQYKTTLLKPMPNHEADLEKGSDFCGKMHLNKEFVHYPGKRSYVYLDLQGASHGPTNHLIARRRFLFDG